MAYALSGIVPVGGVLAWLKSFTNVPALAPEYVECNGQTLSDAQSVYDGQVIPNLNTGTKRFLRGSTTSGSTGGVETHTHGFGAEGNLNTGLFTNPCFFTFALFTPYLVADASNLPQYYEVVFVMRIK